MVKISSFGSFAVRQKGQRIGRNPKTGQEVPISPRRVLVFRASHALKNQINTLSLHLQLLGEDLDPPQSPRERKAACGLPLR